MHTLPATALTLRRLGPADAARYRALRLAGLRAFPHAFRPSYDEALLQPLAWAEQRLDKAGDYWFGAFDGIELAGRRIVIIDDVLATGGTIAAARDLLVTGGAEVPVAAVVLELSALAGREKVAPLPVSSLHTI